MSPEEAAAKAGSGVRKKVSGSERGGGSGNALSVILSAPQPEKKKWGNKRRVGAERRLGGRRLSEIRGIGRHAARPPYPKTSYMYMGEPERQ